MSYHLPPPEPSVGSLRLGLCPKRCRYTEICSAYGANSRASGVTTIISTISYHSSFISNLSVLKFTNINDRNALVDFQMFFTTYSMQLFYRVKYRNWLSIIVYILDSWTFCLQKSDKWKKNIDKTTTILQKIVNENCRILFEKSQLFIWNISLAISLIIYLVL